MLKTNHFISIHGQRELYVSIQPNDLSLPFEAQLRNLSEQLQSTAQAEGLQVQFVRLFLSDIANQPVDNTLFPQGALSVVGQPPLSGAKVELWAWLASSVLPYRFVTNIRPEAHSSYDAGFEAFEALVTHAGAMDPECVRTWFYVRDIDVNYAGFVKSRNEVFDSQGLTPATHFIASTGIAGMMPTPSQPLQLDALYAPGVKPEQVHFISAPEYLNNTIEYGVAFERATSVQWTDRRHMFVSGTASINSRGEIVAPGNILAQTERMLTNIQALLQADGMLLEHIGQLTVYLRDMADYAAVKAHLEVRMPRVPMNILLAPVCRPGWLIEAECIAVAAI